MSKKRFLSIVISAVMILSLACSALAVGQSGRYIGNSTVNGSIYQTYYQVDKKAEGIITFEPRVTQSVMAKGDHTFRYNAQGDIVA